jgi:serine/threonine protein kinase
MALPLSAGASSEADDPSVEAQMRVGTKLNAKWTLDELLGVGGVGAVFAAQHRNGKKAAVKLLHASLTQDKDVKGRFLREAMTANKIDHPARVAIIDDDVSDQGEVFLAMELLDGSSLSQLREERGGKVPIEETLQIFDVVLDLLAKAHEANVVHRDVKPGNIFVTREGQVKVLDFGVARVLEAGVGGSAEATRARAAFDAPSYESPEQARGLAHLVDARTDVFSVGACIFTALSGVRLHEGRSDADALVLAATTPAPSLASVACDVPFEVIAFVDKALAFERDQRFPSAVAMQTELRALLTAWRAGQLQSQTASVTQTVCRGDNDIDPFDIGGEDAKSVLERLSFVWKQINTLLKEIRHAGWQDPQAQRAFKMAYAKLGEFLATYPTACQWQVTPAAFEQGDVALWAPDRVPFDRVPYQLFTDGVRRIQIKEGIAEAEFRDFLALVMRLAVGTMPPGDDAVTFFWDKRFECIACDAVDAFVKSEDERAEIERIVAETIAHTRYDLRPDAEARALAHNVGELLRDVTQVAADAVLDPLTRASLGEQCTVGEEEYWARFSDAFGRAHAVAEAENDIEAANGPVVEWTHDQVALQNYGAVMAAFDRLREGMKRERSEDARAAARALSRSMLGIDTLRPLLQHLIEEGPQRGEETPPLPEDLMKGLAFSLGAVGSGEMLELAAGCYGANPEPTLRKTLSAYLRQWAPGREEELGGIGATARPALAQALVTILAECGPAGQTGLHLVLSNEDIEVRTDALARVIDEDRVRAELRSMLDTPNSEKRIKVLELVVRRNVVPAGPVLAVRIQTASFHDYGVDERKAWLDTVMRLNPRRGEAIAIKLLGAVRIFPSRKNEETRRLAAELLSTCAPTEDNLKALSKARRPWWWNTKSVRRAASDAYARLTAKEPLALPPKEAPASSTEEKS